MIIRHEYDHWPEFLHLEYKQHKPNVADGPQDVLDFMRAAYARFPRHNVDVVRSFVDGDYVILHVHVHMQPLHHDIAVKDIFRVKDGKLMEHWNVEQWDRVIDTNLKSVYFTVKSALQLMSRGASMVFNASLGARKSPPFFSVYAAGKAGVVALGRTLSMEFAGRGIRVNVVSPGPVDTPLPSRTEGMPNQVLPQVLDPAPVRRWAASVSRRKWRRRCCSCVRMKPPSSLAPTR